MSTLSTQVEYGSNSSRRDSSKKSSSTKHSSTSRSKSSSTKSSSKSKAPSTSNTHSTSSSNSSHTHVPSEPLVYYLNDPTHSNPGYSSAYTTALAYTSGYPQNSGARVEMEQEIVVESQARVQENIDRYERQTGG
ncbi:uncharacterized protein K444DRAFT_663756 [Hyaloscypha bicolor E]|uniref:Uncharacterized protein n=1 Tax=Hyaloscypha bicolor E TaxID=1095630 RepID=A0A2J6T9R8_9HELO|nr:uncharacterized protein K444DRAFT_663756 [Hyaloscypha bicolor E]PMD59732.1 hypothetical protein K444DRAFT_663756 [Hyaloscypha bicolor E]